MENTPVKVDRRAARSKRLIIEALRELVLEKDYKKITVSDIVERADIGRATFYAHFEDKVALGAYIFAQLLAQIEQEIETYLRENEAQSDIYQMLIPSYALFKISEEKHAWFKRNATRPDVGLTMLVEPLVKRMQVKLNELHAVPTVSSISIRMTALFLISGLIALLTDWILADMPESIETMDQIYQSLAQPNLDQILDNQ